LVRPNIPLRRRLPRTFVAVVFFFALWAATMALVVVSPGALNTLFLIASQIVGWVFVIAIAIVGAVFIGMFISHRLLTHGGFTPFEEEMLRMRKDAQESHQHLAKLREEVSLMRVEMGRMRREARGAAGRSATAADEGVPGVFSASVAQGSDGLEEVGR
jgi:ABC-type multidrug transport system fused ATPase/permease subunit